MKPQNINPIFKSHDYEVITHDIVDKTKSCVVKAFMASGDDKLEKGRFLYGFVYEPLLEEKLINQLMADYEFDPILSELYDLLSFNYFYIYDICIKWFYENNLVRDAFDFEAQIENLKSKKDTAYSCPIVKSLDMDTLENINLIKNIKALMHPNERNNVNTVHALLYGTNKVILRQIPTVKGKTLFNSVVNIAYNRFLNYLILKHDGVEPNFEEILEDDLPKNVKLTPKEERAQEIKSKLVEWGFLNLKKVKVLDPKNQEHLIKLIINNKLPYQIAMLSYLEFINHLSSEYFELRTSLHKELSKALGSDNDGRSVRGHIDILHKKNPSPQGRYVAHLYKPKVEEDYNGLLKKGLLG